MGACQQEANHILTLGDALGMLWGIVAGSGKVVSGTPSAGVVGSSSMTITGTLALFAALWASILKRNRFRVKQIRYKTKQQN